MKAILIPGYEGEGTTKVVTGMTAIDVFRAALEAWNDPEVTSVVLHKPGSHIHFPDGREIVVGFRPAELEPEMAGSC